MFHLSSTPPSRVLAAALALCAAALALWPKGGNAQSISYDQRRYDLASCVRSGTINSYLFALVNSGPTTTLRASGTARELGGLVFTELDRNRTSQPVAAYLLELLDGSYNRRDALAVPAQGRALLVLEFNLPDNPSSSQMKIPNRANSGEIRFQNLCQVLAAGQPLPWGGRPSGVAGIAGGGPVGQTNNALDRANTAFDRANNTFDRANSSVDRATQTMDTASQAVGSVSRLKEGLRGLFGGGSSSAASTPEPAVAAAPMSTPNAAPVPAPGSAQMPAAVAASAPSPMSAVGSAPAQATAQVPAQGNSTGLPPGVTPQGHWAAAQQVNPALRMVPMPPQAGAVAAPQTGANVPPQVVASVPQPLERPPARVGEGELSQRRVLADGASIGGLDGRPIDLDSNDFRYAPARVAYERFKALVPMKDGDLNDFRHLYGANAAPRTPQQAALKQALDPLLEQVRAMPPQGQAEVMARVIRDIKATNDFGGHDGGVLGGVLAVLNQVPLARNFAVQYKQRPRNRNGGNDMSIDPALIEPERNKSIREFLSQHTIIMNSDRTAAACNWQSIDTTFAQASAAAPGR